MFSLFYGLPGTYWDAFAGAARPPVLMDLFRQHEYQLGLFASSPIYRGVGLDRTALSRVPNLRLETDGRSRSSDTDTRVTEDWVQWLDRRDPTRPFFGFLYYKAAVTIAPPDVLSAGQGGAMERAGTGAPPRPVPERGALRRLPLRPRDRRPGAARTARSNGGRGDIGPRDGVRRERAGLHGTWHVVQRVPDAHAARGALARAAPGARDPPHLAQRRGADPRRDGCSAAPIPRRTTRAATTCTRTSAWEWLIAAGYSSGFAVIEPEQVTVIYPASYEVRDRNYRLVAEPALPRARLRRCAAGDEPVLSIVAERGGSRRRLGLLCSALGIWLVATCGTAAGGGTVRVSGDRLDLVFALDGANPVGWRACHPSCAAAESGVGNVRFAFAGEGERQSHAWSSAGLGRPCRSRSTALRRTTSPRTRASGRSRSGPTSRSKACTW